MGLWVLWVLVGFGGFCGFCGFGGFSGFCGFRGLWVYGFSSEGGYGSVFLFSPPALITSTYLLPLPFSTSAMLQLIINRLPFAAGNSQDKNAAVACCPCSSAPTCTASSRLWSSFAIEQGPKCPRACTSATSLSSDGAKLPQSCHLGLGFRV